MKGLHDLDRKRMVVNCGRQSEHLRKGENAKVAAFSFLWLPSPSTTGCAAQAAIYGLSVLEATGLRSRCQVGSVPSQNVARILPCFPSFWQSRAAPGLQRHHCSLCQSSPSALPMRLSTWPSSLWLFMTSSHTGLDPPYSSKTSA